MIHHLLLQFYQLFNYKTCSFMLHVIILLQFLMQDKGRLQVSINKHKNVARNSFNSFNSNQDAFSNEFNESQFSRSERQQILRAALENNILENISRYQQRSPNKANGQQIMQRNDKKKLKDNQRLQVIREQKLDLRGNKEQKSKVKGIVFQKALYQQETKPNKQNFLEKKQEEKQKAYILQQKQIELISKNHEKLSSNINNLKQNYEQLQKQQQEVKKRKQKRVNQNAFGIKFSGQKQKQVHEFLNIKQMQKKKRQKLLQDIAMKQQHRLKLQQKQQEMLKQRERKRKLKELKRYSKFEDKHIQQKEVEQQKQQIVEQFMKKYQGKVGYHIRAKQIDQQRQRKIKQKEEDILKERKQYYKSLDLSQVIEHQRWHDDKLDQLSYERQQQRQEELQRIEDQNNRRSSDLWRGQAYTIIQDQLSQKKKKKKQPRERARRIRQYKQYIKNNFSPKTYQYKSLQSPVKERSSNSHRQVRRYRYYKGSPVGEIKETIPLPKNDKEKRQIGDNYLQFVKSLPKKAELPKQQFHLEPQDLELLQRKFNGIGKVKRNVHSLYDDGRKKKASLQLVKGVKRDQLQMIVLQLKATDQKLKNKQFLLNQREYGNVNNVQGEQRQINQGFVQNIQRKLTLLSQL